MLGQSSDKHFWKSVKNEKTRAKDSINYPVFEHLNIIKRSPYKQFNINHHRSLSIGSQKIHNTVTSRRYIKNKNWTIDNKTEKLEKSKKSSTKIFNKTKTDSDHNFVGKKYILKIKEELKANKNNHSNIYGSFVRSCLHCQEDKNSKKQSKYRHNTEHSKTFNASYAAKKSLPLMKEQKNKTKKYIHKDTYLKYKYNSSKMSSNNQNSDKKLVSLIDLTPWDQAQNQWLHKL